MRMTSLLLCFCIACGGKSPPESSNDTSTVANDTAALPDTGTDCEQTTGELHVIGVDPSGPPEELAGVRVTISDGQTPFEAILEADGQLMISLRAGDYTASAADSSTGRCLTAPAEETTLAACAISTVTLTFEELDGC